MTSILILFKQFPKESEIIGRLLAGYGVLEIDLCFCVAEVRDDIDMVIKAMFRPRGETQRIDIADAIGRQPYRGLKLGTEFSEAIGGARYCLQIRNQYAHCNWQLLDDGALGFVNLEEVAYKNEAFGSGVALTLHRLTPELLESQEDYFIHVGRCLNYLQHEARFRAGKAQTQPYPRPQKVPKRPPLYIRPSEHGSLGCDQEPDTPPK
jgi:hypothetical protein